MKLQLTVHTFPPCGLLPSFPPSRKIAVPDVWISVPTRPVRIQRSLMPINNRSVSSTSSLSAQLMTKSASDASLVIAFDEPSLDSDGDVSEMTTGVTPAEESTVAESEERVRATKEYEG